MSTYPPQQQWPQQPQQPFPQQPYPQQPAGNPFSDQAPNPYAAPQQTGYYQQPVPLSPFAGLWRQGNVMVMHKLAPLPEICLKSNQKATSRLKRTMQWHHPAVFLALLVNIIVYAVVAMIMTKKAIIHIGITDEWLAIRRRRMIFAWGLVFLSVLLFFAAIPLIDQFDLAPLLMVAGVFLLIGAAIYGLLACRLVWPSRMTDEYIWIKGVHPDFLNRLEVWPYNI